MASTFTDLGLEIMATGENAGTWGDKTNTNLNIVNTAIAGYVEQSIAGGAATTTLTITDGAATSVAQNAVIKLTGSITGNQVVTIPDSIEKVYIITNGTSGAFTVQVKTVSGTGVTFGVSEKTTKLFYSDGTNIVDAGFSGGTDLDGKELILDADGDTSITADTDDQIDIKIAGTDQLTIKDGALSPVTNNDIDLGTASLEFKDAFFDGTVTSDAFAGPLTGNVTGNVSGTAATVTTAAQSNITSLGTLTTLTVDDITINGSTISDAGDFTLDVEGDIILDANGADVFLKDAGTTYGSLTNSSGNLIVKSGTTTALTFSGANVTVAGDLTVSGDDITMGTNTDSNLLIADGTNFNSVAVSSLSEISTAAADDVFLAVDTSGGGLKKITRSAVIAGTGSSGDLANVVEDTTPQLGGNLDMNGADIVTTSNATIDLAPNGTGTVVVRGNTNSGAIVFNCESNSHGQTVIAQPHSASVTNTMLLPAGASSTLVSLVSTDTLTNKTLTSPKINEDVAVTATATELNLLDGATVVIPGKISGTNFNDSILIGHSTTGTLNAANNNTGIGIESLDALTTGDNNVGVGKSSLTALSTGAENVGVGFEAGSFSQSSTGGTYLGFQAGRKVTGHRNTCIGHEAGENLTSGNGNVIIGADIDLASNTGDRQLKIAGHDGTDTTTWITGDSSGNLTFGGDVTVGDDLNLTTDSTVINFGADSDTTLTHTDGTGLTLNSTNKLCFNDASQFIQGASATVLDIAATDEIELTATLIDVVGALTSSGIITANAKLDLNGTELILDADADTSITADTDDQIDIRLAGADDFTITANTFTILSGSTIAIAAGGGITNAGSMSSDITSTGKALVFGF